jgi:hypothetical protein
LLLAVAAIVWHALRVRAAIRRINDAGAIVASFEPMQLTHYWRGRLENKLRDSWPVRARYDVAFTPPGWCGVGMTLLEAPAVLHDPGDAGFMTVRDLPGVRAVYARGTSVSDVGLLALRGNETLEFLELTGTRVSGPGLVHVASRSLEVLDLADTAVDDDGLDRLGDLPALRLLDVARTRVGPGVAHLARFRALRSLRLGGTRVGDDALAALAGLGLEWIDLCGTMVTDAAIPHLERLPKLEVAALCGTRMTREALARSTSAALRRAADASCDSP